MKSQVFGSATSNMLSQFSREPRELPWQPNSEKNSQNYTNFRFLQEIEEFFCMFSRVLWASWIQMCYLNFQESWGVEGVAMATKLGQK